MSNIWFGICNISGLVLLMFPVWILPVVKVRYDEQISVTESDTVILLVLVFIIMCWLTGRYRFLDNDLITIPIALVGAGVLVNMLNIAI